MYEYINEGLIQLYKMATEIKLIKTQEELETLLANNEKVIIKSGAEWCGNCTQMQFPYKRFAESYANIVFAEIDTDKGNLLKSARIPAFHTFHNGILLSENITNLKNIVEIMLNDLQKATVEVREEIAFSDIVFGEENEIGYKPANEIAWLNAEICDIYEADINKNLHPFMVINAKGFENKQSPNNIVAAVFCGDGGVTEAYGDKTTLYKRGDTVRVLTNQKITGKVIIKVLIKDFE